MSEFALKLHVEICNTNRLTLTQYNIDVLVSMKRLKLVTYFLSKTLKTWGKLKLSLGVARIRGVIIFVLACYDEYTRSEIN